MNNVIGNAYYTISVSDTSAVSNWTLADNVFAEPRRERVVHGETPVEWLRRRVQEVCDLAFKEEAA